ncbi:MAG: helix-turn-helix transcriptional regulator [Proteobacteria bacterium]|nr:helix-turn-helix transcriptional regulator [Pseudomonadota bacterium]
MPKQKKIQRAAKAPTAKSMMEDILGCKWSLTVLSLIRKGVHRPGAMEHAVEGLSAKVLNERLRKLVRFGIAEKRMFAEVPPRVEYRLTDFGKKFGAVLDQIEGLEKAQT